MVGSQSPFAGAGIINKIMNWSRTAGESEVNDNNAIIRACFNLSRNKMGALIVIATDTELKYHASTGDQIDAKLSAPLLESIFFKNSPLHDGGVIIFKNRIKAARCILPVSDNPEIPANYGLRHRAAVGLTESSPALAIVVSEENGKISVAKGGKLQNDLSMDEFREELNKLITEIEDIQEDQEAS
tara:strand:- start:46 stop:603 length:558 start_codon:yes stop_codon:yes gene_type:complete